MPGTPLIWQAGPSKRWVFTRPHILAILNLTPDSFSDGGKLPDPAAAALAARQAIADGADGLDLGAESTRPGATRIPADEQRRRLIPAIRAIRGTIGDTPVISIDTTLEEVARAALDEGADAVNDVSAGLESPGMFTLCADRRAGLILMHRLAPPTGDRFSTDYREADRPRYLDVVADVRAFLSDRMAAAIDAGISPDAIVLDPGLGFGKTVEQNLELIRKTTELASLGRPVLSGLSRKSFVGAFMNLPKGNTPDQRLQGTLHLSTEHLKAGAAILRVHDVRAHAMLVHASDPQPPSRT